MLTHEAPRTRRLNIVLSESMIERLAACAEERGISMSAFVRQALEREFARTQDQRLADAAESLATLYETESELTEFTALDGDDFA